MTHGTLDAASIGGAASGNRSRWVCGSPARLRLIMALEPNDGELLAPYLDDLEQMDLLPWCGFGSRGNGRTADRVSRASRGDRRFLRGLHNQGTSHSHPGDRVFVNGRVTCRFRLEEPGGSATRSRVIARVQDAKTAGGSGLLGRVLERGQTAMDSGPPIDAVTFCRRGRSSRIS